MRIGDTIIRVKGEWNLRKVGDIAVIDGFKIYNKGVCVHLEGDNKNTWHSQSAYRLISDIDMPCLQLELRIVEKEIRKHTAEYKEMVALRSVKRTATMKRKKDLPMPAVEELFGDEPEDEPFDFPEGIFTKRH